MAFTFHGKRALVTGAGKGKQCKHSGLFAVNKLGYLVMPILYTLPTDTANWPRVSN